MSTNIVWHHASVQRHERAEQRGHRSAILWFTGLSSPYEPPENPELHVETGSQPLDACVQQVIGHLQTCGILDLTAADGFPQA